MFSQDELLSVPGEPVLEVEVRSAIDQKLGMAAISLRLRLMKKPI